MEIFKDPVTFQKRMLELKRAGKSIALVPTMGYLHAGHASLLDNARPRADVLVVSIFVNPTQFGPSEDLESYPRDFNRDCALCAAHGADVIFAPDAELMYAPDRSVWVEETKLSRGLCGKARPTHFRGVTTVVAKLFLLAQPDVAVFGQKDAQQALVIRRMVRDLNFPIEIVVSPLIRDTDGVAMSSRNTYLSPSERERARVLSRSLAAARDALVAGKPLDEVRQETLSAVTERADRVDYVEFLDSETLEPATAETGEVLIALAAVFGHTRLIDNTLVRLKPQA